MASFRRRSQIMASLAIVMFLGIAVYFRLWIIDYSVSSDDSNLLRRQFDLANREALDESAEWRLRFDEEAERNIQCMNELKQLKESSKKVDYVGDVGQKLETLEKENKALLKQVEALKQELKSEKLRCKSQ